MFIPSTVRLLPDNNIFTVSQKVDVFNQIPWNTGTVPGGMRNRPHVPFRREYYNRSGCTGPEDAAEELRRMEEAEAARREQEKLAGKTKDSQKTFKAV